MLTEMTHKRQARLSYGNRETCREIRKLYAYQYQVNSVYDA